MGSSGMFPSRSNIYGIQKHEVDAIWPVFWPMMKRASKYAAFSPMEEDKVRQAMVELRMQGWYVLNGSDIVGVVLTEIYEDVNGKTLEIMGVAGSEIDVWLTHLDVLLKWGKDVGCKRCILIGRCGWERKLASHDFNKVAVVLERSL